MVKICELLQPDVYGFHRCRKVSNIRGGGGGEGQGLKYGGGGQIPSRHMTS